MNDRVSGRNLPTNPGDLTLEILNEVIGAQRPDIKLAAFSIVESHVWGEGNVSSAGRIVIAPTYGAGSPAGLPRQIVIKVANSRPDRPGVPDPIAGAHGALYANEVNIYHRLKPAEFLEAPVVLAGAHDPASNSMLLLMEDLRERGASFANVTVPTSLERMRSLLDQLALLHGRYWNSPALGSTLDWMDRHTRGPIHDQFNTYEILPQFVEYQVETEQFKREMVERLGTTPQALFRGFQSVQQHQATLPQTVCHGDTHIGNTYILPGDKGGLLDWQLASQGFALHDVSYLLATGLSINDRRTHERELLTYYRERLQAAGAADLPAPEQLWLEYRRAMLWGVYIGWLTTPVPNYGWEITVMAHLRVMTAYEDLETGKLVAELG